jgi:hypothetical protein
MALLVLTLVGLTVITGCSSTTAATPPAWKPLDKATAAKLITFMGYQNVNVAAVIHGIARMPGAVGGGVDSSDSVALVVGSAVLAGKAQGFSLSLFFDKDLGWFYYQDQISYFDGSSKGLLRLWTEQGYREIPTLAPAK